MVIDFFDLDYDVQRQHAKHVTHIIVLLSVPCLPSPLQKNASVVRYVKQLLFYFVLRICNTCIYNFFSYLNVNSAEQL